MKEEERINLIDETQKAIERLQKFDAKTIARETDLGSALSFKDAIPYVERVLNIYRNISLAICDDLSDSLLEDLKTHANSDFKKINNILDFSTEIANPLQQRNALINNIREAYDSTFTKLYNYISYSSSKITDFKRLEREAQATIQEISDKTKEFTQELNLKNKEAGNILDDIRKIAAEQGVSQQSIYFRDSAEDHEKKANEWLTKTYWFAGILGFYAILTIFLHKFSYLKPIDLYDSIQLSVSKILIFTVLSYILYLSARNYLSHKHNSIVNKHRQNALMTYKAILDAAEEIKNKDVILTYASMCIFSPQSTGYSREYGPNAPTAKSVIELMTKPFDAEL